MKSLIPWKRAQKNKSVRNYLRLCCKIQIISDTLQQYSSYKNSSIQALWASSIHPLPLLSPWVALGFLLPSVWGEAGQPCFPIGWSALWSEWAPPPAGWASPLSASAVSPLCAPPPPAGTPSDGQTLQWSVPPDLLLAPETQGRFFF